LSIFIENLIKSDTLRIRLLAGNLIGGLTYSQIQNLKITENNETKLRILITDGKREDLG
jgi:hypothetical protein